MRGMEEMKMAKDEINRNLAVEVMGWEHIDFDGNDTYFINKYIGPLTREFIIYEKYWNPRENIGQAMEVLEKFNFCWYIFRNNEGLFGCNILISGQDFVTSKWQKTPQEAICNAAILAIGEAAK